MSLSINGSSSSNPYLQSLLQQSQPQAGASDPLDALLSALGQGTGVTGAAGGTAAALGSSSPFGPQTLQALVSMQANSSNSTSLLPQSSGSQEPSGNPSTQSADASSGQSSHRHHHRRIGGTSSSGGSTTDLIQQLMQMQSQLTTAAPAQNAITA